MATPAPQHPDEERHLLSIQTKLIDIEWDQLHILLSLDNTAGHSSTKFIPKIRDIYINIMLKIIEQPQELTHWKKFVVLPIILFSINCNRDLSARIQSLLQDKWDSFIIADFIKESHNTSISAHQHTSTHSTKRLLISFKQRN